LGRCSGCIIWDKIDQFEGKGIDNRFEVPQDGCERGPNEGQQVRNKPCFADQDVEKGLMDLNESCECGDDSIFIGFDGEWLSARKRTNDAAQRSYDI